MYKIRLFGFLKTAPVNVELTQLFMLFISVGHL